MSRSGLYLERLLAVPPRWAPFLSVLLSDGVQRQCRRDGVDVPADFAAWLADLDDYARSLPASTPAEYPAEPSEWVGTEEAAGLLGVSSRRVRTMASSGQLRARRDGARRWLIALEDLEAEIEARQT